VCVVIYKRFFKKWLFKKIIEEILAKKITVDNVSATAYNEFVNIQFI